MVRRARGFTLIEAMIVVTLIGLLAVVGVPYTTSWFHEADVQRAANVLQSAYGQAKAVALRNPQGVLGDEDPAAGLALTGNSLLVCQGDPAAAACALDGANLEWRADLPAGLTLTLSNASLTTQGVNNTGQSIDGSGAVVTDLSYHISKGTRSYDSELR